MFILKYPVSHMLYADDTQVYKSFHLDDCLFSILCVEKCVSDIKAWMTYNKLQMNTDKTYVLLVTAKQIVNLQHLLEFMNINGTCVKFNPSVKNLSVTFNSTLLLHQHVTNVCKVAKFSGSSNKVSLIICKFATVGSLDILSLHNSQI